jgi:Ca2+-binding RTX toxin-like protein
MARIKGSPRHDILRGSDGRDRIFGDDGDDILSGRDGADHLFGDAGFDLLRGGAGHDALFGGAGSDVLLGGRGDDTLHGDGGLGQGRGDLAGDRLEGGDGNDLLVLGEGLETATGGDGADRFLFRFNNPQTPLAAGTGAAFAAITDFSTATDTLLFDAAGVGTDAAGANFIDKSGGGGLPDSFFAGDAALSAGQSVMVLTDQGFASGLLAAQAAQGEDSGDLILYFNTTVMTASLLVVSAPNAVVSIARFTDINSVEDLAAAGFSAADFLFV